MKNRQPTWKDLRFAVLAVDTVVLTYRNSKLYVRLIKVDLPPHYHNSAGLPGGLLTPTETAEESLRRHVTRKAGIDASKLYIEQVYTFTAIDRDPRNRVVAVAYMGFTPWDKLTASEQENSEQTWWCPISKLPKLAYDHAEIIQTALERFRARIISTTLISHLLPDEFTLTELEEAYEDILGKKIDKRNFRKKIARLKLLKKLKKQRTGLKARPAALHAFKSKRVMQIEIL